MYPNPFPDPDPGGACHIANLARRVDNLRALIARLQEDFCWQQKNGAGFHKARPGEAPRAKLAAITDTIAILEKNLAGLETRLTALENTEARRWRQAA